MNNMIEIIFIILAVIIFLLHTILVIEIIIENRKIFLNQVVHLEERMRKINERIDILRGKDNENNNDTNNK